MSFWIALIASLPTGNTTVRIVRTWRALKVSSAVALRNGVYLLTNYEQSGSAEQKANKP